ncbi:hypothetical protein BpHYR1_023001 [Brachionus plicatilis]|uniref:Uncharacterized protein n=1 Tax=Brachionus plicatilis TaxID=10195 RepID=A0A3M7QWZ8_BRAPC|nr:hypothetical protein BpHYR1_023001 [Brachionus plicatilis]
MLKMVSCQNRCLNLSILFYYSENNWANMFGSLSKNSDFNELVSFYLFKWSNSFHSQLGLLIKKRLLFNRGLMFFSRKLSTCSKYRFVLYQNSRNVIFMQLDIIRQILNR